MFEGETSRGKSPFPGVLMWLTKLVDSPLRQHLRHLRLTAQSLLHTGNYDEKCVN